MSRRHASETTLAHLQRHSSKSGTVLRLHRRTRQSLRAIPLPSVEPDTRMPPVRIINYYLAAFALWLAIGVWALSTFMEGTGAS